MFKKAAVVTEKRMTDDELVVVAYKTIIKVLVKCLYINSKLKFCIICI